jgi:RimJ/RimL family protein N-acetyltransferase
VEDEVGVRVHVLGDQPVLRGRLVRLEPAGPEHLDGLWPLYSGGDDSGFMDPVAALTREQTRAGLARARERRDRADWAVVRAEDGAVVGEAVLMDLDEDNASMSYRVALVGPAVFGRGYGTETTRLVRDFAFETLGLHRLALEVNAFNAPAIAVYAKVGFVLEGVRREAVRRDGGWYDVHDMALIRSDPRP